MGLGLSWKVHSFYPESNMYLHAKDESPVFPEIENPIFLTSSGKLSWPHLNDHAWWGLRQTSTRASGETFDVEFRFVYFHLENLQASRSRCDL